MRRQCSLPAAREGSGGLSVLPGPRPASGKATGALQRPQAVDLSMLEESGLLILGGASVKGGRGNLLRTILGVLIIGVVGNALTQLGLITFWQDIFKEAILILAVYFDQLRQK